MDQLRTKEHERDSAVFFRYTNLQNYEKQKTKDNFGLSNSWFCSSLFPDSCLVFIRCSEISMFADVIIPILSTTLFQEIQNFMIPKEANLTFSDQKRMKASIVLDLLSRHVENVVNYPNKWWSWWKKKGRPTQVVGPRCIGCNEIHLQLLRCQLRYQLRTQPPLIDKGTQGGTEGDEIGLKCPGNETFGRSIEHINILKQQIYIKIGNQIIEYWKLTKVLK